MQLRDVLKAIRPCDMDQPFIFISYSSINQDRVWRDVLRFQQMGYNIWMDEKNLDKTQDSWRDDALNAIRDMNCSLVVFYVSRHSLISQPCYSELACTVEDYTKAVHFGPVKFIAVDVEPIADITEFSREVYAEIRSSNIPKNEKTTQAITLNNCIEQFFNSNNEKVRVKAYDLPNRKMDYFEEITAAFPDDTRIFPPVIDEEPEAAAVSPAVDASVTTIHPDLLAFLEPIFDSASDADFAFNPVPPSEPELPSAPAEEPSPAGFDGISVSAAEPEPPADADAGTNYPEYLRFHVYPDYEFCSRYTDFDDVAKQALEKANHVLKQEGKKRFKEKMSLGYKQQSNAVERFGNRFSRPDIKAMLDISAFGSGKEGLVLTQTHLYCKLNSFAEVDLYEVRQADKAPQTNTLRILYRDGSSEDIYCGEYTGGILALLKTYMAHPREAVEADTRAKQKAIDAKLSAYWKEFGFGQPRRPRTQALPTDPVSLANFALAEANREIRARDCSTLFQPAEKLSPKQLKGAVSAIAIGENEEDILGMLDHSIFVSGKSGIVLTKTTLYSTDAKKHPVKLSSLRKVSQSEEDHCLLLTYDNYCQEDVDFSSDFLAVKAILDVYLDAQMQK